MGKVTPSKTTSVDYGVVFFFFFWASCCLNWMKCLEWTRWIWVSLADKRLASPPMEKRR